MASEIKARLSLDSSSFSKGIDAALSSLSSMSTRVGAIAATAAGALAAIGAPLTAGAFAVGIKNALDFGGSMSDMSARTGVAVKDLVILGQAFENAGMSAEGVGPAINRMQKALTGVNEQGEPTNKTFARLGLDLEKLKGLDAGAQFAAVSQAIAGIGNPAERAAAAIGIFGKSGGEMLALFRDSSAITTATQQVGAQAGLLENNANAMDKVSDAFNAVKSTLRGFFVGIVEPLLPLLNQVADWLNQLGTKAVELGQKLGAGIATALNIATNLFKTPREQVADITTRINGLKGKQVEVVATGKTDAVAKIDAEIAALQGKQIQLQTSADPSAVGQLQSQIDGVTGKQVEVRATGNSDEIAKLQAQIAALKGKQVSVGATGTGAEVAQLQARIDALKGKTVAVAATAPATEIAQLQARIDALKGKQVAVGATGTAPEIAQLQARIDALKGKQVAVTTKTDAAPVAALQNTVAGVTGKTVAVNATGNAEAVAALQAKIDALKNKRVEVKASSTTEEVAKLQKEIDTLTDKRVTISSQFNTAGTAEIQSKIDDLQRQRVQIQAEGNTAGLATIDEEIKKLEQRKIQLNTDTSRFERLGDLIGLGLKIAFGEAINYLVGGLRSALLLIPALLGAVFSGDYLSASFNLFKAEIKGIGIVLVEAFADAIQTAAALGLVGFQKIAQVFNFLPDFFQDIVVNVMAGFKTAMQAAVSILGEGTIKAVQAILNVLKYVNPYAYAASKALNLIDTGPKKTFEENKADAQKTVQGFVNFGQQPSLSLDEAFAKVKESGWLEKQLAAMRESAGSDLEKAGTAVKALLAKIANDMQAYGADFKPADVVNTADWKKQIAALAASLNVPAAEIEKAAAAAVAPVTTPNTPATVVAEPKPIKEPRPKVDADQFAKIGLFSGNVAGGLTTHMQRTADNTMRMVDILRQLGQGGIRITNFQDTPARVS